MLQHAKEDGFSPEIVRFADDVESEIFYIITEQLIGFFPDHYPMGDYDRSLKKIEIVNSHHSYKIQLAYLKSNKNPALSEFLRYIQNREL